MAGIGLYGVFYSKATVSGGVVTGYNGIKTMGGAISASFTPNEGTSNPLYVNNAIGENDGAGASGGTLSLTLDRLTSDAYEDLYGLTESTVEVTVGTQTVEGTGFKYTGNEVSNPVGVAFIRWKQEDNLRNIHEVVIYRNVTFNAPTGDMTTMGESVEWQTPSIEGTVIGKEGDGTNPWYQAITFPTQAAAIAYITAQFAAPTPPNDNEEN